MPPGAPPAGGALGGDADERSGRDRGTANAVVNALIAGVCSKAVPPKSALLSTKLAVVVLTGTSIAE